jgi:hypothetical protein
MKATYLLLATIIGAGFLLLGSSNGAGFDQGEDRTGSPISTGTCGICHSNGVYSPTIQASLLDKGVAVKSYTPGKVYTLEVKITPTKGTPNNYGFQSVVMAASDNSNAGAFGTLPTGVRLTSLFAHSYVEQSRRSSGNTFDVPWTAPAKGKGSLRIYASGIAANGNGTSGDGAVSLTTPLVVTEATATGLQTPEALKADIKAYPNPVLDELQIQLSSEERLSILNLTVYSLDGREILQKKWLNPDQAFQTVIETSDWQAGIYFIRVSDGERLLTKKVIKF